MRIVLIFLLLSMFRCYAQEIVQLPSFDGETIVGRLNIPVSNFKNKIVIDVPSTGPFTYETKRKIGRITVFNYHDYFSNEFAKRGIAYFSYNTRYTVSDTIPPNYDRVDKYKFFTYTPSIKVKDVESIIKFLKKDIRLSECQVILLGWSEGSIIASLVAERKLVKIYALFLAGIPTEDVYSSILWQHSGAASMINMRKFFDLNNDSIIQKTEYSKGDPRLIARLGGQTFEQLDMNHDTILTTDDFRLKLQPRLQQIITAINKNDDEWIWNSFFRVGTKWIKEHKAIEPNKTRILKLNLPVYIFHGSDDANTPVQGIFEMKKTVQNLKKNNIHFYIFPENDHSLEFISWVVKRTIPIGIKTMIEQVEKL